MRMCEFAGCKNAHAAKGLCHTHYQQAQRGVELKPVGEYADLHLQKIRSRPRKKCARHLCDRPHSMHGYCEFHARRHLAGLPMIAVSDSVSRSRTLQERIESNSTTLLDGHVIWVGLLSDRGYGSIRVGKNMRSAHRVAWECANGPVPGGLWLDHTCNMGHLGCVDLRHLRLVTPEANRRRQDNYPSNTGYRNISYSTATDGYAVSVTKCRKVHKKWFKNLEPAIRYRNDLYQELEIEIEGEYFDTVE